MTKIQVSSDLHLDQIINLHSLEEYQSIINPVANILILAGDVCHIYTMEKHVLFFEYVNSHFQFILYIPGNHEFYNDESLSIDVLETRIQKFLQTYQNIVYLNNRSIVIDNILFTGSCMWCNPEYEPPSWFKINLSKKDIKDLFNESVFYLDKVSKLSYKNHIIITHYPPIYLQTFKINKYNDYYYNNNIILTNFPNFWIFGHIHKNIEKNINDTKYVSNQYKDKRYSNSYFITNITNI